ncbi:MAG TPA: TatD family deoxyribonuclease [Verrucomicrobiales bacterium]|nr:TatD family deoxyribonuclease [Verrucomicrobiales bacterium]
MTDSHCHLGSDKFTPQEIPELIARAKENGVNRMVTLATCPDDLMVNLLIAREYPEVSACIGIHPCDVHHAPDDFEELLEPHLDDSKVAAIGETGLDYFHPAPNGFSDEDYHARQRDFLHRHFELAKAAQLNVVIHTRDKSGTTSFDDALSIYAEYAKDVRAVFHCFPGPPELAERVFATGGLISFTGIATFKKAATVVDTVKAAPSGSFMLETDSPYLSPVPHRGKRCEPAYTRHTAKAIASQRNISLESLTQETEQVVESFFRL